MAENAIDQMKIDELQAKLAQAQEIISDTSLKLKAKNARLEEKNKEVEELQKQSEKRQKTIDSLIEENEKLVTEQNAAILILGGWIGVDTIYLLDSKAQSWKELRITLPVKIRDFGAVALNDEIYIFGGKSCFTYHQHCYKLKHYGSWTQLASMNQKRSDISSSSLVYKGDIWVIGGYSGDPNESLKSVEKYDISQDKWIYMPEMNYTRWNAAAAVFKDRIFVTGGSNEKKLKSVEMFDPKLQKWILFCDLPFELHSHTMLINNSTLSIFGGQSESGPLNSVWEMDIEDPEKKWTQKQSFKHPRYYFGIGKLSNGITVFGGFAGNGTTSEIFDGKKWISGPELPIERSCFAYTSISRSLEERFLEFKRQDREELSGVKQLKRQRLSLEDMNVPTIFL